MQRTLKLAEHDEERERKFELNFLRSLSVRQRFEWMFLRSRELLELMERRGHRRPVGIAKRT